MLIILFMIDISVSFCEKCAGSGKGLNLMKCSFCYKVHVLKAFTYCFICIFGQKD